MSQESADTSVGPCVKGSLTDDKGTPSAEHLDMDFGARCRAPPWMSMFTAGEWVHGCGGNVLCSGCRYSSRDEVEDSVEKVWRRRLEMRVQVVGQRVALDYGMLRLGPRRRYTNPSWD